MKPITDDSQRYEHIFSSFTTSVDEYSVDNLATALRVQTEAIVFLDNCVSSMEEALCPRYDYRTPIELFNPAPNRHTFRNWSIEAHRGGTLFSEKVVKVVAESGKYSKLEGAPIRSACSAVADIWEKANTLCKKINFTADFTVKYDPAKNDVSVKLLSDVFHEFEVISEDSC